jgi:hypothetical protein
MYSPPVHVRCGQYVKYLGLGEGLVPIILWSLRATLGCTLISEEEFKSAGPCAVCGSTC